MEDARVEFNSFEPSLDEVLAEPIVRRLMRRDGVTEESCASLRAEPQLLGANPAFHRQCPWRTLAERSRHWRVSAFLLRQPRRCGRACS